MPDTFIKLGWFEQITLIETDIVSSFLVENNDLLQEVNLIAWSWAHASWNYSDDASS